MKRIHAVHDTSVGLRYVLVCGTCCLADTYRRLSNDLITARFSLQCWLVIQMIFFVFAQSPDYAHFYKTLVMCTRSTKYLPNSSKSKTPRHSTYIFSFLAKRFRKKVKKRAQEIYLGLVIEWLKPPYYLVNRSTSRTIINSSFVGINKVLTVASAVDRSRSTPRMLFFSGSTPMPK